MLRCHAIVRAAALFCVFFFASLLLAQSLPSPSSPLSSPPHHHGCFENSVDSKNANKRLSPSFHSWLAEDAVFIITPDERCAFLHLNTDEERNQFIERFWYLRDPNPDAPDNSFRREHYRRIAFADQKYSGPIDGWKTDRGRIYVIFGPPDSIEASGRTGKAGESSPHAEKWHYPCREDSQGIDLEFIDANGAGDYRLVFPGQNPYLFAQVDPNHASCGFLHSSLLVTSDQAQVHIGLSPVPTIRFKDLEAIATSQRARDQLHFRSQFQFLAATHATTLARLTVDLPFSVSSSDESRPSQGYALFVRVASSSGRVADIVESVAKAAPQSQLAAASPLQSQFDLPLSPGSYQVAIVAKNLDTNNVGVVRTSFDVPSYDALTQK